MKKLENRNNAGERRLVLPYRFRLRAERRDYSRAFPRTLSTRAVRSGPSLPEREERPLAALTTSEQYGGCRL